MKSSRAAAKYIQVAAAMLALLCLSSVARADSVSDAIAALKSKDVAKRSDAAQSLAKQKSSKAMPALIIALGDPVETVRKQALRACAATIGANRSDLKYAVTALADSNAERRAA